MARHKKTAACPNCCPDGGADFDAVYSRPDRIVLDFVSDYNGREYTKLEQIDPDAEDIPCWECQNCGMHIARRVRSRPDEHSPLTRSQLRAITEIQQCKLHRGYEVKMLNIAQCGSFVSVAIQVGINGDEGTMASILCREYGHFFVGRRGKITAKRGDAPKTKLAQYPLIYGWDH